MTREEAIEILWRYDVNFEPHPPEEVMHAIDMAIEALSADTSSDLISRANAIRWVKTECNPYGKPTLEFESGKKVIEHLEQMPSTEPKMKWIPCSERLPSAEDCPMDCMVTRRSKYVGNYTDMAVAEADGTWTHEDWKAIAIKGEATCISTRDADIIAWMPLPKPYKGGDTE